MGEETVPESTQFYSDYFKSLTGQIYYLRKNGEEYEYWAFTRWVVVSGSDKFILDHLNPISDLQI